MGKLYTLDGKLLVGGPELRVGDKVYPVDDREKTFRKAMDLGETQDIGTMDQLLELGLGKEAYKEIRAMNMPFAAYSELCRLVVAAMTGEEPGDDRFQQPEK